MGKNKLNLDDMEIEKKWKVLLHHSTQTSILSVFNSNWLSVFQSFGGQSLWIWNIKEIICQKLKPSLYHSGFPWRLSSNESACQFRRQNLGSERCPGVGNGPPLLYSCLENFMDRGFWQALAVHGVEKSWTWLTTYTPTNSIPVPINQFNLEVLEI